MNPHLTRRAKFLLSGKNAPTQRRQDNKRQSARKEILRDFGADGRKKPPACNY
nr:MAG TPA: hypothetical protein [Caudoviricetes sp.]